MPELQKKTEEAVKMSWVGNYDEAYTSHYHHLFVVVIENCTFARSSQWGRSLKCAN